MSIYLDTLQAHSEIENGGKSNILMQNLNQTIEKWENMKIDFVQAQNKCLKTVGLDETPGALISHALLGLLI